MARDRSSEEVATYAFVITMMTLLAYVACVFIFVL